MYWYVKRPLLIQKPDSDTLTAYSNGSIEKSHDKMTDVPGDLLDMGSLVQAEVSNAQIILSALERAPDHLKRK